MRGQFAPKLKYVQRDRYFFCHWCGMETSHALDLVYVSGIGIKPAYICVHCGQVIPEDSLATYLKTGDVVIKNVRRRDNRCSNW